MWAGHANHPVVRVPREIKHRVDLPKPMPIAHLAGDWDVPESGTSAAVACDTASKNARPTAIPTSAALCIAPAHTSNRVTTLHNTATTYQERP
jgi:hypothetical protein